MRTLPLACVLFDQLPTQLAMAERSCALKLMVTGGMSC